MMDERLMQSIEETCGSEYWEPVTGILWEDGTPWQILHFGNDVELDGLTYRCEILRRVIFDPDDLDAVDTVETLMARAWVLR